jgi:hypothetical protein
MSHPACANEANAKKEMATKNLAIVVFMVVTPGG